MPFTVREASASPQLRRSLYAENIGDFLARSPQAALGELVAATASRDLAIFMSGDLRGLVRTSGLAT